MINDLTTVEIGQRAKLIFEAARSQSDLRLWQAALGDTSGRPASATVAAAPGIGLEALLGIVRSGSRPATHETAKAATPAPFGAEPAALGANGGYRDTIGAAARRTGIPTSALAAIIDAESARDRDGRWRTNARNPRSTATGIGQFLAGTWRSEAERAGTWLNRTARAQGWIGANGAVLPAARSALLALREDGEASIHATADYARRSLDRLAEAGIAIGDDVAAITSTAYIGHNLGLGDAIRYVRGNLGEARAKRLLEAQIGASHAGARIAGAGSAVAAHRQWLGDFISRRVRSVQPPASVNRPAQGSARVNFG